MKKLILTVGPCGSGKSTWAKKYALEHNFIHISQDELGKDCHMVAFKNALLEGSDIIIDRMNFNEEQRKRYIEPAKASGYTVIAKYFNESYETCLYRVIGRKDHPTIKEADVKVAREVLDMYYEKESVFGLKKEVDEVWDGSYSTGSNKKVLNLDSIIAANNVKEIFVITDPHGCFDDAMEMLKHMGYIKGKDLLIIIGDLNDRGPDADKMLHFALYTPNVFTVLGNHDCVKTNTTEFLTDKGFVSAKDITMDMRLAQFNKSGNINYSKPLALTRFNDNGYYKLYANKNNLKYEEVSKNHKVLFQNDLVPITLIGESNLLDFKYSGRDMSALPQLYSENELRFITQIVMDATIVIQEGIKRRIQFKLSKPRKIKRIESLLNKMNIPYTKHKTKGSSLTKLQPYLICIYADNARYYIDTILNQVKEFPEWFKYLSKEQLTFVLDEISMTDGISHNECVYWTSTNKNNIDTIQIACINNGIDTHIKTKYGASGFKNGKTQYLLTAFMGGVKLKRKVHKEWVAEFTNFTAVTMPLGTIITRTNGAISFTGNCKLRKWLKGNKVNTTSLLGTIEQLTNAGMTTPEAKDDLYYRMMDMPYIIKAGMNYFSHAGFHPYTHPENTSREFCLFARHFDPAMGTFTRDTTASMWFTHPRRYPEYNLFFGHIVQETMPILEDKRIYAMDGGICFGETNRGAKINLESDNVEIFEIPSTRPKRVKDDKWDAMNKFEPYDKLVEEGYLQKKEKGSLVLYNYNDKCTYDKHWNRYTMECRGLILDKDSGLTVARPFPKFFNLGELENKTLPQAPYHESYTVEDKLDGSLGIMYRDPADDKFKIATRGSFDSDQAKKGTEILDRALDKVGVLPIVNFMAKYTPLFEIIYPENRVNDGARLVCNYGNTESLILLAAIDKVTGKEATELELKDFADTLHFPLRQVYPYTLEQVVAMQKTLPVTQEGFVVKFASGFRVKVKGDEYCKMQRILNGINPLAIWEQMCASEQFLLTDEYKKHIPEEIMPEVESIETRLRMKWAKKIVDFQYEYVRLNLHTPRELGMFCHNPANGVGLDIQPALFMVQSKRFKDLFKYTARLIRPTNNKID